MSWSLFLPRHLPYNNHNHHQALQMGDEDITGNKAGTSLFIREILADVYKTHFSLEQQQEAIGFIQWKSTMHS